MNIHEFRAKYPQYDALSDADLATRLYQKHYADKLAPEDFGARFGVAPVLPDGMAMQAPSVSRGTMAMPVAPQPTIPVAPPEPYPTKGAMQTGPSLGDMIAAMLPDSQQDGQMGYTGRGGVRSAQAAHQQAVTDAVQTLYPDAAGEALAKAPGAGLRAAPEPTDFRQLLDGLVGNPDAVPPGGDPNVALYLAGRQAGLDDAGEGRRFDAPTTAKIAREQIGPAEGVAARGGKDFAAGAIQTGGGLLGYAARMTGSNALREGQLKITQKAADLMPSDPNFFDKFAAAAGSTATFWVPGMGLAKGAQAVASVSPRMAMWLGSGAAAGMEAAVESGAVYEQALAEGMTDKQAAKAADRTFWQNAGLLAVTNKLGLFGETGNRVLRRTYGAAFEGGQEGVQQVISNRELGHSAGEGVGESAAIGALVGAGASGNVATPQERLGDQVLQRIESAQPDPQQVDQAARDALDPANAQQHAQPQRQEVPAAQTQPQPRQAAPAWTGPENASTGPMPGNVDVTMPAPKPAQEQQAEPAPPEPSPQNSSAATPLENARPTIEPGRILNIGLGARVKLNPLPPGGYWRETNENGLDSLLMDNRTKPENENITPHPNGMFVTNDESLAIGQGGNKGVLVKFRGDALSGREHQKPGTGIVGGKEFVVDAVTADAIDEIIMPKGTKVRGLNQRELRDRFDMRDLGDGRAKYTRKGMSSEQDQAERPDAAMMNWWEDHKPVDRAELVKAAGWGTPKGNPTKVGRQIAKSDWNSLSDEDRQTLTSLRDQQDKAEQDRMAERDRTAYRKKHKAQVDVRLRKQGVGTSHPEYETRAAKLRQELGFTDEYDKAKQPLTPPVPETQPEAPARQEAAKPEPAEQAPAAAAKPANNPENNPSSESEKETTHGAGTLASGFDPAQAMQAAKDLVDDAAQRLKPHADRFVYLAQDRFNSLKAKQKQIGNVPEDQDAYLAEERFHGRTRKRLDQFDEDVVQPMLQEIRASGLSLEEVEQWLHARHAEEANAHLESINPGTPNNDALSGMSDAEAMQILAQHRGNTHLQQVGVMVDDMNAARLDIIETEELDTPENVAAIREAYDHYVPLHRAEVERGGLPARGQGFNVKGKETKRRVGSNRAVENILPHLIAQYETTLIRAEKARVHRALYELATAHPDPEFWTVDKAATKRVVGPDGLVRSAGDPRYKERDNVLTVKKGGEEFTIEFNPDNEYAVRIAHGMKNLEQAQMGWLLRKMSTINRWLSAVNTGWNPEFVISNLVRDLQTAVYNLNGTDAEKLAIKVMKDWPKALRGIHSAVRGDKSHDWAKHFDEFEQAGGRTGWMEHYETIGDFRDKLLREFDNLGDSGWAMTKRRVSKVATLVRDYNDIVENAIRLSVYVNARKAGVTAARSASVAKNITVNFNRKGAIGPAMNAAYLFYNASIQGSARLIQAVATSRRAQMMVGATIVFAALLDMLNRDLGGDDDDDVPYYDKVPDYVKERNLIIMRGDGDYVKIPLPWGYNVFHVIGQELGSAFTKDGFSGTEAAGRVAGSILGAFSPIGSEGSGLQMVSPTLLDPAVQIAENKDFTGRKLMPVDFSFSAVTPDSELYWNGARDLSKSVASELNAVTGGNKAKPGAIDISPETFDLWIDFATGGLGRTVANTADTAGKLIVGEPLEDKNTPIIRKVKGKVTRGHDQTEYYDNLADVKTLVAQLKTYRSQPDMLRKIKEENRAFLPLIAASKTAEKEMRKLRKARRAAIADGAKDRQERIEARMDRIFKWFNTEYRKAESRDKAKPFGQLRKPIDRTNGGDV